MTSSPTSKPTMAPPPDVRLSAAYLARYNRIRARTAAMVGVLWDLHAGLDDQAAERFITDSASTVRAAQGATTALVNGYIATAVALVGGAAPDLDDTAPNPRGVEAEEVYQRGIVTARAAVSDGRPYLEALAAGRARSVATAATDVLLVQRDVMTRAVGKAGIVGYRRVLTGESCVLCQTASTQRYHTGNLMPIHGHCDCGVAPIIGERDPGQVVNQELLDELKASGDLDRLAERKRRMGADSKVRTAERRAEDARRQLLTETDPKRRARLEERVQTWEQRAVEADAELFERITAAGEETVGRFQSLLDDIDASVRQHGELGPVIVPRSHDFTGPGDIAA